MEQKLGKGFCITTIAYFFLGQNAEMERKKAMSITGLTTFDINILRSDNNY